MRIQHNIMAMSAYRNYTNNVSSMQKNLEKLSSGYKINRAGDDAAGLAISEKMRAQITGLEAAQKNAKDGVSLVKTAEGALQEVHDMLNRMSYLATQSANGTYDNDVDRYQLQKEVDQLRTEINRIADSANFNGIKLLDGSLSENGSVGMTSTMDASKLPTVGPTLGTDTVVHSDANSGKGTQFSIDLHNVELSNASGGNYTLKIGNGSGAVEITFAGVATGSSVANVGGSALINSLLSGSQGTHFQITAISVGGSAVDVSGTATSGATASANGSMITLTGTKFGDIEITKGSAGGDNRLTFTQVNPPTSQTQVWKPAGAVHITGTTAPANGHATSHSLDDGFAVDTLTAGPVVYTASLADVTAANTLTLGSLSGAITIATSGGSVSALGNLIATADGAPSGSTAVNVKLAYASGSWTIKASGVTIKASVSVSSGVVSVTSSSGTALFSIRLTTGTGSAASVATTATIGTLQTAFGSAGQIIGSFAKLEPDGPGSGSGVSSKASIASFGVTGSSALSAILTANASFASAASAVTNTASSLTILTTVANLASTGSIGATAAAALKATFTVGSLTVHASDIASIASSATVGAALQQVVDGLNAAAARKAQQDYAALPASGGQITVYSNFRFEDASGTLLTHAINGPVLKYDTTVVTLGNNNNNNNNNSSSGLSKIDYQFETTAVNYVDLDGGDRLASTHLTSDKWMDKVADGNEIQIGKQTYTFTTDKALAAKAGNDQKYVYIGEEGNMDDAKTIAQRITWAARENTTYTVGCDSQGDLSFTEIQNQTEYFKDGKSTLTSKEAIAKTLGFTSGKVDGGTLRLQIGDTAESFNQLEVNINDCHTSAMGVLDDDGNVVSGKSIADIDISTQDGAQKAVDVIKSAINYVSDVRGTLGATQNRLEHTQNNLSVMAENIQDAESTIRDTDVAEEMMAYTKNNILVQSAQAMLAQANQVPQGVLQLLG